MIGSKLLPLLASLSSTEFRRMRKIFQSPFFTTNERHLVLYELLRKYHPIFDTPALEKERVFEKLYPGKPLNDNLLRVLIREFTQMTEEYLLLLKLREEPFQRKKMLSQIYKDRDLYPFFAKESQKLLKELEAQPFRDWEYYREIYELNFDYFFHPNTRKFVEGDAQLVKIMESLDRQFALAKFRIGSEMTNRARAFSKNYDIHLLQEVQNIAKTVYQKDNVLFKLYELLFELYESAEKDLIFEELKLRFSENFKNIRSIDQSLFLTQLINFTVRKLNIGETSFYKKALDLYKIGLEADLVLKNGSIDEAVYGNIILLGCHAKEFVWVKKFLNEYKVYLKKEIREDAFVLNTGVYFFHLKEFDKAQFKLMSYGFSFRYQPKVRSILIMIIYDQFKDDDSFYELLISQMNSFEKFLHRNSLKIGYKTEAYFNLISIVKKLVNGLNNKMDKEILSKKIEESITSSKKLNGKKWLLDKIDELRQ